MGAVFIVLAIVAAIVLVGLFFGNDRNQDYF